MNEVIVNDKRFEVYIPEAQIASRVKAIASAMNRELREAEPLFLVVLNGAFFFAADLLKELSFPYEVSFVKLASYEGMQSAGTMNTLIGLDEKLAGRCVVIVEDIIDTGRTISALIEQLRQMHVSDIKIATLILKPGSLQHAVRADYTGFEAPDEFLIGFGLDFNKKGRHFRDIFKIVTP
jgi:hypoxanthine phosphoribosyltransferase